MPQLPLMNGSKTTKNARYLDLLPVNMVPTIGQTQASSGYMRSFPGITEHYTCNGPSFGGQYNSLIKSEFRVLGSELYSSGEKVADITGGKLTSICHSPNSVAFVDDEKLKYYRDGQVSELKNWAAEEYDGENEATTWTISGVIDVDRHEGRYVWINKDKMGCTALNGGDGSVSPEQRPDFAAPFSSSESDPDENKAVKSWQGKFVAVFGRNTCQWFGLTGNAEQIYLPQKSMQTQCGIVSTHAVCKYKGAFAAIGGEKGGTLQAVIISPGGFQKISTPNIDSIINNYKESELQDVLLESLLLNNQDFLFMHLPNETLVFDGNQNIWFQLQSGIDGGKYSGRHILYDHEAGLTIGDSVANKVGKLDDSISSQYGQISEFVVYTPYIRANTKGGMVPLFDLRFDSVFGHVNEFQTVFISYTLDGNMYGNELRLQYNNPLEFLNKPMISNLGSIADSIGFKLRVTSKEPVNLSGFSVRVGYGN